MSAASVTLSSLHTGQSARIVSLDFQPEFAARLRALGVDHGKTVQVLRQAIWGGPMHLGVGLTEVMLRRVDANLIQVAPLES